MISYELESLFFKLFFAAIFLVIGVIMVAGFVDMRGSYMAQSKEVACAQNQMTSYRYAFTDSVVCVPYPTRQDTLTVKQ